MGIKTLIWLSILVVGIYCEISDEDAPVHYCFVNPPPKTRLSPNLLQNITTCTHLVYGSIPIDRDTGYPQYSVSDVESGYDIDNIRTFMRLRKYHPNAKLLMGVVRTKPFEDAATSVKVANGLRSHVKSKRFDGLFVTFNGIHLEYRASTSFLETISKDKKMSLTFGVTGRRVFAFDALRRLQEINDLVEYIYLDMGVSMMDSDYDIVHTAMEIPTFARALNAEPKSQLFLKENQDSQPRLLVSTAEKNGSVISNFKSSWNHYYIEDNSSSDENISQMPSPYLFPLMKRQYIGVRTSPKYYALMTYKDDQTQYIPAETGCPAFQFTSFLEQGIIDNSSVCYWHNIAPGITQLEAKELCELQGMKLLIERYEGAFPSDNGGFPPAKSTPLAHPLASRVGFVGYSDVRTWLGLERDPVDKTWKWSEPSFSVKGPEGKVAMTWGPGEPKEAPENNCAYLRKNDSMKEFPNYALFAAPCNSNDVDGFSIGSLPQSARGIPTWTR